jgi:DNA-binding NarL/FixJ family response regulator
MTRHNGRTAVLLDEHPLWLDAVASVLGAIGIEVVAKATDADDALSLVAEFRPDLVIAEIDLAYSDADGIGFIRRVTAAGEGIRTIVLSRRDGAESISDALAAGATAYVVKTAHPDDLAAAVRQAFGQSLFFGPGLVTGPPQSLPIDVPLTRRESEILALVAEGRSNAQLAHALWVTEQTVKFHLSNIYRKLGVSNRTEAARWAPLRGLVSADTGSREEDDEREPTPVTQLRATG